MVTIRPIPKTEVRCNKCNVVMGHLEDNGDFTPNDDLKYTFMRFHIYDIVNDGDALSEKYFEVDFCQNCTKEFEKIIKKFKLNRSSTQTARSE